MKRVDKFLALSLALLMSLLPLAMPTPLMAQANLRVPSVTGTGLLAFKYTAGVVNNGGHAVTIAAGTGSATASQNDCAAPTYTACYFVYTNSSGTVAGSTAKATVGAAGNVLLALIETDGTHITRIVAPQQNGTVNTQAPLATIGVPGALFTSCTTTLVCTPGTTTASVKVAYGNASLSSASPSTAAVSGISPVFGATTTMFCTATPVGTTAAIAAGGLAINITSTSAFTVTGPNTVTTNFNWFCIGT